MCQAVCLVFYHHYYLNHKKYTKENKVFVSTKKNYLLHHLGLSPLVYDSFNVLLNLAY